ncbi:unnamed protein product, partial [Callosobruchus maculatus]
MLGFILARDGDVDLLHNDINDSYSKIEKWAETKKFPQMYMQQFPHNEWWRDPVLDIIGDGHMSSLIVAIFLMFFGYILEMMVLENERQLKEYMKIMGLTTTLYWMSWFLQVFFHMFILLAIYVTLVTLPIIKGHAVFVLSSPSLILFFLMLWGAASITLTFIIAASIHSAVKASIVGVLIWLVPLVIFPIIFEKSTSEQLAASLWSTIALGIGVKTIWGFERVGEGANWQNLFTPASAEESTSLGIVLLILLF